METAFSPSPTAQIGKSCTELLFKKRIRVLGWRASRTPKVPLSPVNENFSMLKEPAKKGSC